jgi:L-ascorbate metabolism protein UlaG (beta-lactamase superfamily)
MIITKFSQSTFIVENKMGKRLLIDPGKYNFENNFKPSDFGKVDILIITHKHEDHHSWEAEKEIINLHSPLVITNHEIGNIPLAQELKYSIVNVGDKTSEYGFEITYIAADHFAKCELIINFGMFIVCDGTSFYHTSDTRFMESCYFDYELVKKCDVLAVPISNRGVVMGLDDSIIFTSSIEPKFVIPMHYDSPKDRGRINPNDFVKRLQELSERVDNLRNIKPIVLNFNSSFSI